MHDYIHNSQLLPSFRATGDSRNYETSIAICLTKLNGVQEVECLVYTVGVWCITLHVNVILESLTWQHQDETTQV